MSDEKRAGKGAELNDEPQTLISHLLELRTRLLRIVAVVLGVFLVLMPFANKLFSIVADPLIEQMPAGTSMIATEVASPFLTPFKLALVLAIFISVPVILHQAWAFIAPGLYNHERRLVMPLLTSSVLLFYLGVAFAYFVVFPLMFGFFTATAPDGVAVMTDINNYLNFILVMFFAFGIAFEVPVATVLLVWTGVTTPEKMGKHRAYILLGAFVAGMLLTPPDVISQTLLALPIYLLFEIGVIMARVFAPTSEHEVEAKQP
ncbi:MAG: twin-arginine translocase subunit TatC [Pseudomonadota bacterium]